MKKYLAFDVGGTSVKYAVVNEEGGVSSSNKFKTPDTLEKIQQAALDENSEKSNHGTSQRQIVKHAGVTTGAFYGYFSSKEALFASIVAPHAAILMSK